ncbi:TetR/AcrR family transcriptional regulator C-terminal domain-containing protein [Actinomadura vinacea]|uniref:TetR/AcrR family transcriptional regulator C-terminal domain-containing protein n=1 Tax=Actinomadura vinacea TaxID=115336 RepID=A0ABN3IC23_9ACTN
MDPERLWLDRGTSRLGRPPARTRPQIVAEAIAIADADGLAAVTMRRVAAGLGVGTMTLYTYASDKRTLVELMIDAAAGEVELAAPTGDWRTDLRAQCHSQREVFRRHPWLHAAQSDRRTLGPNLLAFMEHTLAILEPTGRDGPSLLEIIALLTGFIGSHVLHERTQERAGTDPQHNAEAQSRYLHKAVAAYDLPRLAALLAAPDQVPPPDFEQLLNRMIEGLLG